MSFERIDRMQAAGASVRIGYLTREGQANEFEVDIQISVQMCLSSWGLTFGTSAFSHRETIPENLWIQNAAAHRIPTI